MVRYNGLGYIHNHVLAFANDSMLLIPRVSNPKDFHIGQLYNSARDALANVNLDDPIETTNTTKVGPT